jgi:starch phosphorylase
VTGTDVDDNNMFDDDLHQRRSVTESTASVPIERRLNELKQIAANLRWSWHRSASDLLTDLPGADPVRHPLAVIAELATDRSGELTAFLEANADRIAAQAAELEVLEGPPLAPAVAYFCPEYGIAAQFPQYSGGLGILAGDHLKAASDLALPLIGVGLFYRQGFFRQEIVNGAQVERIETVDPEAVGAADTGVRVEVPIGGERVVAAVRQLWVGATRLLLLDTDVDGNSPTARSITNRLYAGGRRQRLDQELVLGVGGVRALRALDCDVDVYHLNEGHACFLLLELLAERLAAGDDLPTATEAVRGCTLFTTHTPVPAGIDRFGRELVAGELEGWADRLGVDAGSIADWATLPSDGADQPFNTAALAFTFCGRVNGVSQLHAQVSRKLFRALPAAAAIEGVTNGVHARTWIGEDLQDLYDRDLGKGWENGDSEAWSQAPQLDQDRFRAIRAAGRRELVDLVRATTGQVLDPDRPIFGFARRFATYKRAALLLRDADGLRALLEAGAQFVFAGKAHPADAAGKAVLASITEAADGTRSGGGNGPGATGGGLVLVPDYDIHIAKALYAGTDVWLNNPIRRREACGTSGEKAALNGVLNCSISDGWWADWYVDGIGWEIPISELTDPEERDDAEAVALTSLLRDEVLPVVDDRGPRWWSMVAAMLVHLGPLVTAGRMVEEYDRRFYQPIRLP